MCLFHFESVFRATSLKQGSKDFINDENEWQLVSIPICLFRCDSAANTQAYTHTHMFTYSRPSKHAHEQGNM